MTQNIWHDVEPGNYPEQINVVIEIPQGSQNKYEFDKVTGLVKLDRVLYSSVHYPADYGLIPQTLAGDGDPLDALVLVTNPTLPGVLIEARPIGVMEMIDEGEPDDKIICVPINDMRFNHMQDISDIPQPIMDEITHFFESYKHLEGKTVEVPRWQDAAAAKKIIIECVENYTQKFSQQ